MEKTLGKNWYVISRVVEVYPDENGRVRTVTIASLPKNSREKSLPYSNKGLQLEKVSVQRLVLLQRNEACKKDDENVVNIAVLN